MVVNKVILKPAISTARTVLNAKTGNILEDILKIDDKVLDDILLAQQKAKTGIFKSTPWMYEGRVCDARTLQEIGTKLAYNDLQLKKISQLAAKYETETRVLKLNGSEQKFTIYKGSRSGSNPGAWAQLDSSGELYYIKFGNEAQIRSECLAGELYELGGIPSTKKVLVSYTEPAKNVYSSPTERVGAASKFMPVNYLPEVEDAAIVREGFGMDCWLANWDALKNGNVVISAGNAARLDVGGSLCYRARGGRKGAAFGENVGELTSFFDSCSLSKPYIKNMTRDELISSLDRVSRIADDKIVAAIDKAAAYKSVPGGINPKTGKFDFGMTHITNTGIKNPQYLKETLIARKEYITQFKQMCLETPQQAGETIEQYIRRIDSLVAKKTYNIPFEKIQMSTEVTDGVTGISMAERLTPAQKKVYEESLAAYKISSKNKIIRPPAGDTLSADNMLHATSYKNLDEILRKGITTGDARGAIGTGTGCATQTPLCADFWDVQGNISIKDYFARPHYNPGEANFLPRATYGGLSGKKHTIVFVVNKNNVSPTIMKNSFKVSEGKSILYQDGNMAGHTNYITHRAVPIGVPANTIDRIIINESGFTPNAIDQMKELIASKGLNIRIYDLEGNLL